MKKEKRIKYICLMLFFAVIFSLNNFAAAEPPYDTITQLKSEAFVLMDGDTGQVLLERNMNGRIYPASTTKVMTAMLSLEKGSLTDIITMSYDAVFSVGRDTSHIALDENEQLTLEHALYGLAICSANDAANGIAELIGGSMPEFARQMTMKAKELGAVNTNFANAHGLHDDNHYTTVYDMALIMSAAVKIPEFTKIFSTVSYTMPPTNKQPESRPFNRKNSLIEGPDKYDGIIAEKTGWTGDAGFTYTAAAKRNGRTLVVVIKSPSESVRWEETAILFDYGFNEFTPLSYNPAEFGKDKYVIGGTDGSEIYAKLIPDGDFNCLIPKSLNKNDIEIKYVFSVDAITGKTDADAIFVLKPELSEFMFEKLGKAKLKIYFTDEKSAPANGNAIIDDNGRQSGPKKKISVFSVIFTVFSVILQIIGFLTVIWLILYIRKHIIVKKRQKRRQSKYNKHNNYNNNNPMFK